MVVVFFPFSEGGQTVGQSFAQGGHFALVEPFRAGDGARRRQRLAKALALKKKEKKTIVNQSIHRTNRSADHLDPNAAVGADGRLERHGPAQRLQQRALGAQQPAGTAVVSSFRRPPRRVGWVAGTCGRGAAARRRGSPRWTAAPGRRSGPASRRRPAPAPCRRWR